MLVALSILCMKTTAQTCGGYNPSPDDCISCVKVNLPVAPLLCPGASFTFTPSVFVPPGFTIKNYAWSGTTVTPASGTGVPPTTTITPPLPASPPPCSVVPYPYTLAISALGPNVVMNPDFSSGNTDFCTQYSYNPTPSTLNTTEYSVCSNANVIPGWGTTPPNFYGHTTGTPGDNMLVAQGDANVNHVWEQTVPVCPGEAYDFSFWMATLHTTVPFPAHANLYVSIMDAGGLVTTSIPFSTSSFDSWTKHSFNWFNPALPGYTSATIFITGGGPTPGPWSIMPWGTAFAIDDISFNRECKSVTRMDIKVEYPEIKGATRVCVGSSIPLNGCPAGGTWSSTAGVTVNAMGNVTGVTPGIATVTYTSPNGCTTTTNITVNALPLITGPSSVCEGSSITWTATGGISGLWSISGPFYYIPGGPAPSATFWATGAGAGTVTYKDTATGCATTVNITVNPRPVLQNVHVCVGASVAMPTSVPGGTWSSSNPMIASIDPFTGVVTGVSAGSAIITYTSPAGCIGTATVFVYNCANGGGIVGSSMCQGQVRTFTTATGIPTGGTWSSSDTTVATVDPVTGVVTAVGGGSVTISYTVGGSTWFTTISVIPPATASVTVTCCDYVFHFTSTCSSTATIYYYVMDYPGSIIGSGITTPGSIPLSTIIATYPSAVKICVYGVWCNGCWWPVNDCASVNPGVPKTNSVASNNGMEQSVSVIPNPNKGVFTISGTLAFNSNDVKIEVVDMVGKILYSDNAILNNGMLNKSISLSDNIANGVYFIRITNQTEFATLKFVLDR